MPATGSPGDVFLLVASGFYAGRQLEATLTLPNATTRTFALKTRQTAASSGRSLRTDPGAARRSRRPLRSEDDRPSGSTRFWSSIRTRGAVRGRRSSSSRSRYTFLPAPGEHPLGPFLLPREQRWQPESESQSRSRARSASGATTRRTSRSGTRPTGRVPQVLPLVRPPHAASRDSLMARQTKAQRRARRAERGGVTAGEAALPGGPPAPPPTDGARRRAAAARAQAPASGRAVRLRVAGASLKKVEWPTQKQIIQATVVVLVACIIVGTYLWLADLVFKPLVEKVFL